MALKLYAREDMGNLIGEWFEGDHFPLQLSQVHMVRAVHATGAELSRIKDSVSGVMHGPASQNEQTWFGDTARNITATLLHYAPRLIPPEGA